MAVCVRAHRVPLDRLQPSTSSPVLRPQEHALSLYAVCKRENCEHRPAPKVNIRHSQG